jgi:hypothetical protein
LRGVCAACPHLPPSKGEGNCMAPCKKWANASPPQTVILSLAQNLRDGPNPVQGDKKG